jgi:hypothetical protein
MWRRGRGKVRGEREKGRDEGKRRREEEKKRRREEAMRGGGRPILKGVRTAISTTHHREQRMQQRNNATTQQRNNTTQSTLDILGDKHNLRTRNTKYSYYNTHLNVIIYSPLIEIKALVWFLP